MDRRIAQLLPIMLLAGHLILLSAREQAKGGALESALLGLVTPVIHAGTATVEGVASLFDSFRLAPSLRVENAELRKELETLRHETVRLQGVEEELERLARIARASLQERFTAGGFFVADVVYLDTRSWLRTVILNTGAEHQAKRNQPVVTAQGLVGRVIATTPNYAKVLLLTDRSASASGMLQNSRRRGIVRGDEDLLLLENIPKLAKSEITLGEPVVTGGIDGIFPRGIQVGTVASVEEVPGLFLRIRLDPAIDFSLLEQVFVLTGEVVPANIRQAEPGDVEPAESEGTDEGSAADDGEVSDGEVSDGEADSEASASDGETDNSGVVP